MVWKKILNFPNTGFGTFSLAFAFALFFSFFLGTHNTFADVSDITYSFDFSNIPSWYELCSSSTCSSYHYMFVEPSNSYTCSGASGFYVYGLNSPNVLVPACVPSIISLDPNSSSPIGLTGGSMSGSGYSGNITITLTNSLSSEPCPVCPVIPDNPYDDKFDKIIVAIYTCGAILLIIYFFYCIYGMIIKSTGGK